MSELRDLILSKHKVLPGALLSVRFSRSGGPGGQNVNKVATKVDLRLDLEAAVVHLGESAVELIKVKLANRLDANGWLQITSNEHRERTLNITAALARMEALLKGALVVPRKRKATRPTRASREQRLNSKRLRSSVKKFRSKGVSDRD